MVDAQPPVLLVVGSAGAGKTCLVQRLLRDTCELDPPPTVGAVSGTYRLEAEDALRPSLRELLPPHGLEFEVLEIGGREPVHREMPRGRHVCGLLLCYDSRDRTTFLRCWHILCRHRMDRHMEISGSDVSSKPTLACVLCATKIDAGEPAVTKEEAKSFAEANGLTLVQTSARSGKGVHEAFQTLVGVALDAETARLAERAAAEQRGKLPAARSFALPCGLDVCSDLSGMTSPPGARPREPQRGVPATEHLVEVLDKKGHVLCGPRSLAECLDGELLHRAVHVWICVPRTGALLLRRWSQHAPKHPGRWGPSCHSEVRCYGRDGHASEVSTQAAERCLVELGIDAEAVGEPRHCFSCETRDGNAKELLDVYLAPLGGAGLRLPELRLQEDEEVDWVFFMHVLSPAFASSGRLFHYSDVYRRALARRLRDYAIPEDVYNAFALDLDAEVAGPALGVSRDLPLPLPSSKGRPVVA